MNCDTSDLIITINDLFALVSASNTNLVPEWYEACTLAQCASDMLTYRGLVQGLDLLIASRETVALTLHGVQQCVHEVRECTARTQPCVDADLFHAFLSYTEAEPHSHAWRAACELQFAGDDEGDANKLRQGYGAQINILLKNPKVMQRALQRARDTFRRMVPPA